MTKEASEAAALKCNLTLEEENKTIANTAKMLDITALVVCDAQVDPELEGKPKLAIVNSLRSRLGKIVHRLYNLESSDGPEKPLSIDLDLYQMENY